MNIGTCVAIAPYLKDWYEQEISLIIIDREQVLYIHKTRVWRHLFPNPVIARASGLILNVVVPNN
jgi:hypothetical protein